MEDNPRLGLVTGGSLSHGVDIRLESGASVEDMAVGRYVTINGKKRRFFGMVTDVSLQFTDERISIAPPDISDPFMSEVLAGTSTFGSLHVLPMLTIGGADDIEDGPQAVKTVPSHFSDVRLASQQDVEMVFGGEDDKKFYIGTPLDMETKICLNLPELVKRSNGIFGKSGTGKTFLARLLLVGMLQKSAAVSLVFDMHSEYGWQGSSEGTNTRTVKGLKQLFPDQVAVFTLDAESSRRRGVKIDVEVKIGYDEIEPEDIGLLRETLKLTELSIDAVYQLARRFGKEWIPATLAIEDTQTLPSGLNINENTFKSLQRGLKNLERLQFIVPSATDSAVKRILDYLDRGINVVLEFGRYTDITAYILVANLLTRRIYNQYRQRTERANAEGGQLPRPLVITIEEAHRFLNNELAGQTIFGDIAREMRKFNATLLVIDQRPSGINEEIMSQLGTKITCLLDNEHDVDAVLAGASGKNELKSVLARLDSKQQALIFGHAVPMPVVVRTRDYGSAESYKDFTRGSNSGSGAAGNGKGGGDIEDLWK